LGKTVAQELLARSLVRQSAGAGLSPAVLAKVVYAGMSEFLSETRPPEAYWIDRCRKTTGERRQKATIAVSA